MCHQNQMETRRSEAPCSPSGPPRACQTPRLIGIRRASIPRTGEGVNVASGKDYNHPPPCLRASLRSQELGGESVVCPQLRREEQAYQAYQACQAYQAYQACQACQACQAYARAGSISVIYLRGEAMLPDGQRLPARIAQAPEVGDAIRYV